MSSTFTASLRFEMQGTGENLNAWGIRLNSALSRIDKAIAGRAAITLAGAAYTLSVANLADDEARNAILDLSGVGNCNLVVPALSKVYLVRNGSSGDVTVTTGAGSTVVVAKDDVAMVACDGSAVTTLKIAGLGLKEYVDAQAWNVSSATLPGQAGNANKFLKTNGTTPSWASPVVSEISNYASDQTTKRTEILATAAAAALSAAVAMAAAL